MDASDRWRGIGRHAAIACGCAMSWSPMPVWAADDEVLLEFHFEPIPDAQIAIWLEDADGNFLRDVYVTQAVGKLGIGNRPGLWNFVSSWRAPYGPRTSVLPVWAHRRGKSYPKIRFHDSSETHKNSLGFHEGTSSYEGYFCRPLTPEEQDNLEGMDNMTCPSPQVFQTDKGRFDGTLTSVYPPRNDITMFEDGADNDIILEYDEINDLDAVTGATPSGDSPEVQTATLTTDEIGDGPIVAWIEVHLEDDQHGMFTYDREDDHYVDPLLSNYGIGFLGQPSIVWKVEFDPTEVDAFHGTMNYAGYGEWDGMSGVLHPPGSEISETSGHGADRLTPFEAHDQEVRFGVYSHGVGEPGDGGVCSIEQLPAVENLTLEAVDHDIVQLQFKLPDSIPASVDLSRLRVRYSTPVPDVFDPDMALDAAGVPSICRSDNEVDCLDVGPGDVVEFEVGGLFGNYEYAFSVSYEDLCNNESAPSVSAIETPRREFQTVEGFCFIATAAWGGSWVAEVAGLRHFRDVVLRDSSVGRAIIHSYYAYGPSLAGVLAHSGFLRAHTRRWLQPVAEIARHWAEARHR